MMSMQDMFYSNAEPVWVIKAPSDEKKKEGGKKDQEAKKEYSILNLIPDYPYYYPPYNPPPAASAAAKEDPKKEKKLSLRVSICCGDCSDRISVALKNLPGVKDVDCSIWKKKVIVTYTTAAAADVILESRKVFKDAREWTDNDE